MKQITMLITITFLTIFISCGGGKSESSSYNSDSVQKNEVVEQEQPTDKKSSGNVSYKKWLKDYESFVDNEYIPLMKKINAGDTSAMGDMQKYMDKATKLSEQAAEMQGDLSGSDLSEFMTTYSRIAQKLSSLQ